MSNRIYQPLINPIKFVLIGPTDIPQYVSRHMDDWLFRETRKSWEQGVNYISEWLTDDSRRLQYVSNFGPLTRKIYDCKGKLIYSVLFDTKQEDKFKPGYFIRQSELDLNIFEPGVYYERIPELSWISEPFEILEEAPNTVYIEFRNDEYYQGMNFDVPFDPTIRVPGILKYKNPGSKDVIYPDQDEAETMLHSTPFRIWQFILGGQRGVPPWLIDKIARIFGCSDLKIDGRYFTKNESANWEAAELDGYPMAGWSIELREKYNRDSLIYDNDVEIIGIAAAGLIADTKGFGMNDNSGNDYLEIASLV